MHRYNAYSRYLKFVLFGFLIANSAASSNEDGLELYSFSGLSVEKKLIDIDGEFLDQLTNSYYWETREIYLPGNAGLDLEVYRSYGKTDNSYLALETWELEVPRIRLQTNMTGRTIGEDMGVGICLNPKAPDITVSRGGGVTQLGIRMFTGLQLVIPGIAPKNLLFKVPGTQYPSDVKYVTTDHWIGRCVASGGTTIKNVFEIVSPEGIVYLFDKIGRIILEPALGVGAQISIYATEKRDVKGNWIRYFYNDYISHPSEWGPAATFADQPLSSFVIPYLSKMESSDGRVVDFLYEDLEHWKRLKEIHVNDRIWTYNYTERDNLSIITPTPFGTTIPRDVIIASALSEVVLPDATLWSFEHKRIQNNDIPDYPDSVYFATKGRILHDMPMHEWITMPVLTRITSPENLRIDYEYIKCNALHTLVLGVPMPLSCNSGYYGNHARGAVPHLAGRKVTNPGGEEDVWIINTSAGPNRTAQEADGNKWKLLGDPSNRVHTTYRTSTELIELEYLRHRFKHSSRLLEAWAAFG